MEHTRRSLLASAGALAAGSLAGCLGARGGDDTTESTTAQASFFVFGDVAATVAGDATSTDLLVPIGQHGHGWEPGPRVRESIRDADLLVHGMTGFQPWVDDIAADLAADDADVRTVDASAGVDLLPASGDHDHGDDHSGTEQHEEGEHHDDHTETEHHEEGEHHDDHTETEHHEEGEHHDDHTETEHHEDGEHHDEHTETEHHEEESDSHDHAGAMDPHFWMDPRRVADATATVQEALSAVDPDAADAHADNAESFVAELDSLDDRIAATIEDAPRETILVAGHNSFQYLGDRYGVHVESLTGVGPDDQPTTRDIERARELVETHDLRYVCADPIESQRAADQIVAETDAEAVLPLTAMPGLTDEWADDDWGYLDVMREVNLPTLERVLTE